MTRKNGTSRKAAQERRARFVHAYMGNGENATDAYLMIAPHVKRATAGVEGHKLLKDPKIHEAIKLARAELRRKFAMTPERVVQELTRVAFYDPRRMLDPHGKPMLLHKLDDDTAAGITLELDGAGKVLKMRTVTPSAKNAAVRQAVKMLRLEDKPLPPPPDEHQKTMDPRERARVLAFLLKRGAVQKEDPRPATPRKKKALIPA